MKTKKIKQKSFLAASVALALSGGQNAFAQTGGDDLLLEEVVVTATKRAVNLQDIPVSVTAISGSEMVELGITDVLSLDKAVPGLVIKNSGNDPTPIMRGAGAAGTTDIAVPIYIDGQYRPRSGQALASYIDVERVEVLRGPQGTLFGRNTLGGLINVISQKPHTGSTEYGFAATVGDYSQRRLEGFVNLPLGETVALRVTASDDFRDPFVENSYNSKGGLKDADMTYARAQIKWEPSEEFDITFVGTYWKDTANGNADYAYKVLGIPINPATGKTNGISGVLEPRQGTSATSEEGRSQAGQFPDDWTAATIADPYEIATDIAPFRDIKETSFSAIVNWDVGFASLHANIGMFDYEEFRYTDTDISPNPTEYQIQNPDTGAQIGPGYWSQCWGGPACGLVAGQRVNSKAIQADINLNSNGDGPLQWTLGYFLYDDSEPGDTSGEFVWGYVDSTAPSDVSWAHWLYQGNGGSKSTAIYGQAEYAFGEDLRVTAGLRRSTDERNTFTKHVDFGPSVHGYNANYYSDHLENPGSRFDDWPSFVLTDSSEVVKGKESHTDWRIALQYDLNDDTMVYASAATGYIAGGPKGGGSTELTDPNEVESFELGIKSTLLDGAMRVNLAYYQNDFSGLSTTAFVSVGGTILAQQVPGGSMSSSGLEAELYWQATQSLVVSAGLSMDNSELDEFSVPESRFSEGGTPDDNGDRVHVLDGKDARFSPDLTLNLGLTYTMDLGDNGSLVPGMFLYYSDEYKTQNVEYFFAKQDAYTNLDLRATWFSADQNLSVQAFVKNATDELVLTETTVYSGDRAMADFNTPRFYGLRVGYNF